VQCRQARAKLVRKMSKKRHHSAVSQIVNGAKKVNEREMISIKRLFSQPMPTYFTKINSNQNETEVAKGVAIIESSNDLFERIREE